MKATKSWYLFLLYQNIKHKKKYNICYYILIIDIFISKIHCSTQNNIYTNYN